MSSSTEASSSTNLRHVKPSWEDDAWKIDSDDDEFKAATQTSNASAQANGAQKTKVGAAASASASSSTASTSTKTTATRHAPPAHPHPYSISPDSSTASSSREGSSIPNVLVTSNDRPSISSNSIATQSGWTLIERTSSGGSVETGVDKATERKNPEMSAKITRRDSEIAAQEMKASIQSDLDDVLRDPTLILSRLSLGPKASRRVSRSNSNLDTDATRVAPDTPDVEAVKATELNNGILAVLPEQDSATSQSADVVTLPEGLLERKSSIRTERRRAKFIDCLNEEVIQMDKLRALAWAGMPDEMRPIIWMLLLGYLPPAKSARASTLARKRAEYQAGVRLAFQRGTESLDQAIWHQIHIDVPRTNPGIALWQREATQRSLERILYVWAIRHPASGYVQGINDLATPFFQVFLSAYVSSDVEQYDVALLPPPALEALEADTFWCLSKLLDGIQDNYIFAQPGIQRQVRRMGELVGRINPSLHAHLEEQGVEYMQFAFRWMNCLLMRELSVRNIVRMWDTYLAEGPDAFSDFHLYVCSAFLNRWDDELRKMDFQGIIMFLQSLPTQKWTARETELLLADAFVKKSLFGGTAHLTN